MVNLKKFFKRNAKYAVLAILSFTLFSFIFTYFVSLNLIYKWGYSIPLDLALTKFLFWYVSVCIRSYNHYSYFLIYYFEMYSFAIKCKLFEIETIVRKIIAYLFGGSR